MRVQDMKTLLVFLSGSFLLLACATDPNEPEPVREPSTMERRIAHASGSFGLTLFRELSAAEPGVNQFVSPVSISLALGMTLNGAGGATYDSMKAVLGLTGLAQDEINASYSSLMQLLHNTDPTVSMHIAQALWYRSTFSVEQPFIDALTASFEARVQGLDFASPSASPTINQWVSDATAGRIPTIVPEQIPPLTMMYLINARSFKGNWAQQFDPARTRAMSFTLANRSTIETPFMTLSGEVRAGFPDDGTTILELGYGKGYYRMAFMLPPSGTGIDDFIAGLTRARWDSLLASAEETQLVVWIPKFRMAYERSLKSDLTAMGMGAAFTDAADFHRINPNEQLSITEVQHKTFVQVDETGTEAAAATSVGIGVTSLPRTIMFDRPFVFAIRDANTGTAVFIGKMMEPAW
jgi:serpin B